MGTDEVKKASLQTLLVVLGVVIFVLGGIATGSIDLQEIQKEITSPGTRPELNADALYLEAMRLYNQGDNTLATEVAQRITRLHKEYIPAHKLLAALYLQNKNYSAAAEQCRAVLQVDPTDISSRVALGTALKEMKQFDNAIAVLQAILEDPQVKGVVREEANQQMIEAGGSPILDPTEKPAPNRGVFFDTPDAADLLVPPTPKGETP
jgi:tetratricopeptide (TPR) repeat protein